MAAIVSPLSWAAPAFPDGPVHLVVPFPAGGPTDTLARMLAEGLQARWKQPVIVENKPGAGTLIGTDHVARAAPDGRTMGIVISAYTINPSVRRSMPYDTLADLQGITQLAESKLVLVTRADAPFNTVAELIARARRHPGELTYASPGAGTSTHLAGEMFKQAAGIDIVHVPYKGSGPAQTDLVGGQVDVMFDVLQSALPMVRSGRLKVIALASPQRDAAFPQYPTVAETLPGFEVGSMFGLIAPARTPAATVAAIRDAAAAVVHSKQVAQTMAGLGMTPVGSTPAEFNRFLRDEIEKWRKVAQQANVRID
ncbi:tripartite tricarboxylate transporter substrate binding protein [Bordetella petrii]|nr:tripartite tricarboxylate transporter substrate binding protein [Bordetella petrii]